MSLIADKRAIQQFISAVTGLSGSSVIWERQNAPAPSGDYISLSVEFLPVVGEDHFDEPLQGSPSDYSTISGERILMLHIRIFVQDFHVMALKILMAFQSREQSLDLKKRQIVHVVFDDTDDDEVLLWSWEFDGVPFTLSYETAPTMDELITDAAAAVNTHAYKPVGLVATADLDDWKMIVHSDVGKPFQFAAESGNVLLSEYQQAVFLAYRGNYGVQTVPEEVRTEYHGTGALDVLLATTISEQELMEFIETIEVTNEGTGELFTVDVDDPPE